MPVTSSYAPLSVDVLCQVVTRLQETFGVSVEALSLRIQEDPEDGAFGLILCVQTAMSPAQAVKALDEFDQWWVEQPVETCEQVTIMPQFVEGR